MAVLIGSVPCGFTFHDLVGGSMINTPSRCSASGQKDDGRASDQLTRERRMRIYLPDGAVREMTLTEYQEFLVSYRVSDTAGDPEAENTSIRGEVKASSTGVCVEAASL